MPKPVAAALLALAASLLCARDLRTACDGAPEVHTETVASGSHAYTVRMEGRIDGEMTRDPVGYWAFDQYWEPNLYVRLENIGEEPIVNPWLRRAGRPDTRSIRSIVDSIIQPSMSDAEKARRLWEFEIKNRFHATTDDEEVDDTVKRFNCYGYTLCGNESLIISDLWRAAGLRVRKGYPNGHSTAEVFFDGAWRLMDSDESIICLLRDNRSIASEAQIVADHDLMKRTHTYGPLHDDSRMRDESSAALHYWEGDRTGEQPQRTKHTMDYVLRPRESITWAWHQGNRFHGKEFEGSRSNYWNKRWRLLAHVMNGELAYTPDFTAPGDLKYVETRGLELRAGPFGRGLYLNGAEGSLVLPVKSPYPVVGGRLEVDFHRADQGLESVMVAISFDAGRTWRDIWTAFGSEYTRMYIDLDEFFPAAGPARYEYQLRFSLASRAPQPVACLKGAHLRSTLQMARLALPGVSLGANQFTYTDESGPGRKARITHSWRECAQAEVPGAPAAAVYPADGGTAGGTQIRFRWQPPAGGPEPADYEFRLSAYPDMRWVLSPNFHKLIARTADRGTASFQLPYKGLLNPGESYYWRVRARSAGGVWGPWSKIFSFQAAAPAVPSNVAARFQRDARKAVLSWEPGAAGTKPARYRIYGSAERGFTAYDQPYIYDAGLDGRKNAPPNLLMETRDAAMSAELPAGLWRAYYRVAAVDAEGRESGPSDQAELARPLIATSAVPPATAAAFYQAAVAVSASIGHLVSANKDGKPYHMMFRGGDDLEFELSGAPEGLSIGRKDGVIAGYLPARAAGKHELLVKVSSRQTGAADAVKLTLEVR